MYALCVSPTSAASHHVRIIYVCVVCFTYVAGQYIGAVVMLDVGDMQEGDLIHPLDGLRVPVRVKALIAGTWSFRKVGVVLQGYRDAGSVSTVLPSALPTAVRTCVAHCCCPLLSATHCVAHCCQLCFPLLSAPHCTAVNCVAHSQLYIAYVMLLTALPTALRNPSAFAGVRD